MPVWRGAHVTTVTAAVCYCAGAEPVFPESHASALPVPVTGLTEGAASGTVLPSGGPGAGPGATQQHSRRAPV